MMATLPRVKKRLNVQFDGLRSPVPWFPIVTWGGAKKDARHIRVLVVIEISYIVCFQGSGELDGLDLE